MHTAVEAVLMLLAPIVTRPHLLTHGEGRKIAQRILSVQLQAWAIDIKEASVATARASGRWQPSDDQLYRIWKALTGERIRLSEHGEIKYLMRMCREQQYWASLTAL